MLDSPFYRSLNINSQLVENKNLTDLPVLNRADLKTRISEFLSFKSVDELSAVWSSGTTGDPICVYRNEFDENRLWNIILSQILSRKQAQYNILFLCALKNGAEYSFIKKVDTKILNIKRFNIYKTSIEDIFNDSFDVITTSPLGLSYLLEKNIQANHLLAKSVYSTALPLSAELRFKFENFYGISIVHTYSSTETGPIAIQCHQNANIYHVFPDIYVETQNSNILISKYFKSALPLLRYCTGDSAEISSTTCSCGFAGQSLLNLKGRK